MRIGVSLLTVQPHLTGGNPTFVRAIASRFSDQDPDRYRFFVHATLVGYWRNLLPPAAHIVPCRVPTWSRTLRTLYEMMVLPRVARRLGCDVIWYPSAVIPLWSEPVPVVTLLDVMCLSQPHEFTWYKTLYFRALYRAIGHARVHIVTISEFSKHDIVERVRVSPARLSVIRLGVDEAFYETRLPILVSGTLPDRPFLLSVSAAYPHKRICELIDAFELVAARRPGFDLVLVGTNLGDAGEQRRIAHRIRSSPVAERIHRMPPLQWGDLPVIYQRAAAVVHVSGYEGFGFPVVEALAAGTPVVAAPAGAVVEVLSGHGIVTEGWDADEVSDAILGVLGWSTDERNARTREARRWVRSRYRWEQTAHELQAVFRSVSHGHRGRRSGEFPTPGERRTSTG